MALYKDLQGNLHDDMDGTATHLLPDGCIEITDAEADAIRQASIVPIPLSVFAQLELDKSDIVAIRCIKAGVAYPSTWQTRDIALRAIVNGTDKTSTTLPSQLAYPIGT